MPARATQRLTRLPVWSMIGKRDVASVNKHFKNLTFPKLFFIWFTFFFVLLMINMQTIKSGLLASVSGAVLGVFLLICRSTPEEVLPESFFSILDDAPAAFREQPALAGYFATYGGR